MPYGYTGKRKYSRRTYSASTKFGGAKAIKLYKKKFSVARAQKDTKTVYIRSESNVNMYGASTGTKSYYGAEIWYGLLDIAYNAPAFNTHVRQLFDEFRLDAVTFTITPLDYNYITNPNHDCGFTFKIAYDNNNNNSSNLIAAHGTLGLIEAGTVAFVQTYPSCKNKCMVEGVNNTMYYSVKNPMFGQYMNFVPTSVQPVDTESGAHMYWDAAVGFQMEYPVPQVTTVGMVFGGNFNVVANMQVSCRGQRALDGETLPGSNF